MGCFWKALFVLFASGLSPVLCGTLRGNCFGRALALTSSSSPLSLMGSLKLEEIKPPQFALSRDELSRLRKEGHCPQLFPVSPKPPRVVTAVVHLYSPSFPQALSPFAVSCSTSLPLPSQSALICSARGTPGSAQGCCAGAAAWPRHRQQPLPARGRGLLQLCA